MYNEKKTLFVYFNPIPASVQPILLPLLITILTVSTLLFYSFFLFSRHNIPFRTFCVFIKNALFIFLHSVFNSGSCIVGFCLPLAAFIIFDDINFLHLTKSTERLLSPKTLLTDHPTGLGTPKQTSCIF